MKTILVKEKFQLKCVPTLCRKRDGYMQQDKKKNIFNAEQFVTILDINRYMTEQGDTCYYCKEHVKRLYVDVRDGKQWSLDRIDNNLGHNTGNVVIACLDCNLKRRRKSVERYSAEKSMLIVVKLG